MYEDLRDKIKEISGFDYIDKPVHLNLDECIFITHCCRDKNPLLSKGTAEQLYIGNRNKLFYANITTKKVKYCTLSDKYGLVFPEQIIETYDTAPTDLSEDELKALKEKIKGQIPKEVNTIVYYCSSPIMVQFYLRMFKDIDLKKIFITKFNFIDNFKPRGLF